MSFPLLLAIWKVVLTLSKVRYRVLYNAVIMASRYVETELLDYCFNPRYLQNAAGDVIKVPCGKCDGCLLHRQNEWSMRVATEIEYNPYTIFFTLTYNNHYLPKLLVKNFLNDEGFVTHRLAVSNHPDNIRFDSVRDVVREDNIVVPLSVYDPFRFDITNFEPKDFINYMSKRDVQLWLKLLRRDIETYLRPNDKGNAFRYYIISEIGPTTRRCHAHGLLFCSSREISEYLLQHSLYENWKMCDEVRFRLFTRYTDSGAASYVSNYVSSVNSLPSYYRNRSVRPWRLASKAPSIGYSEYDFAQVQEKVSGGNIEYVRRIKRLDECHTLSYPKGYLASKFPKCYRFNLLSPSGLLWVYGALYRDVVGRKIPYDFSISRLSKMFRSQDLTATRACYRFCVEFGCTPFHYLYILDMVYYLLDMKVLKMWYQWQERNSDKSLSIIASYCNIQDFFDDKSVYTDYDRLVLVNFLDGFGVSLDDLDLNSIEDILAYRDDISDYEKAVEDVLVNAVKVAKFNEMFGNSPHNY